ncbi:hypothetical protein WT41_00660 [Burkholderia territorii]|nr:hypothetical protein WT41_00660 [Burkholderia territorii]
MTCGQAALAASATGTAQAASAAHMGVAQIVERNVAARGGLQAWRAISTMKMTGELDAGGKKNVRLPFTLTLKRPNKTRFEITVMSQKAVRMFDGREGWKQGANGGSASMRPYTIDEARSASDEQVIDGPLIDHGAKGIGITLDGIDQIDGHDAYRLALKLPSGALRHVWIDSRTFLDVKLDREVRGPHGPVTVEARYGDYRRVGELQIPFRIESGAPSTAHKDVLVIDKISLNPPLDDAIFTRPASSGRRRPVAIDADATPVPSGAGRPTPRP